MQIKLKSAIFSALSKLYCKAIYHNVLSPLGSLTDQDARLATITTIYIDVSICTVANLKFNRLISSMLKVDRTE